MGDDDTIRKDGQGDGLELGGDETIAIDEGGLSSMDTAAADDPILASGFSLGKYRVLRHLASGAMGHVYEAEHTILRKRHALKIIRKRFSTDPDFVSRFRYEARVMAALDHPNIVRVTDFGTELGSNYFVMDFVSGPDGEPKTLQDLLGPPEDLHPLPEDQVREIFTQIGSALEYSHGFGQEGIVHRDLKPSNIMLQDDGQSAHRVAVADFGLARMLGQEDAFTTIVQTRSEESALRNEEIAGTPKFMSPEQWTYGAVLGPGTDIYSVGIMLYLCLTGRFPYSDSRLLVSEGKTPNYRKPSAFGCSKAWDLIVDRCLQAGVSDRYPSAAELRADIERVGQPAERRGPGALAVVAAILVGLGVVSIPLLRGLQTGQETVRPTGPESPAPGVPGRGSGIGRGRGRSRGGGEEAPTAPPVADPLPEVPPPLEMAAPGHIRVDIDFAEGSLRPMQPPNRAQLRVDDGAWRTVYLPHIEPTVGGVSHRLSLRVPGFEEVILEDAVVPAGATTNLVAALGSHPVPITITSNAEDGEVFLGDRKVGQVGEPFFLEPFKLHTLTVRSPRYEPRAIEFNLTQPQARHADYYVEMARLPAELRIEVEAAASLRPPERGEIWLNGKSIGEQDLPYIHPRVEEGPVTTAVEVAGFKPPPPQVVELTAGRQTQARFSLEYLDTFFRFRIDPPTARIVMNGEAVTAEQVPAIPNRFYSLRAEAPDYEPRTFRYTLTPGQTREVAIVLQPYTYMVFELDPPDATVFMKGKRMSGSKIRVEPGVQYAVDIRAKGRKPYRALLSAERGETKVITVELDR